MKNISGLQQLEVVYVSNVTASGSGLIIRLEQESVMQGMDCVTKFSGPEDFVVDSCVGEIAVSKKCLLSSEH